MKIYLIGISVTTRRHGNWIDRGFGTHDGPITAQVIARWEKEAQKEYTNDWPNAVVQVFTFRELGA